MQGINTLSVTSHSFGNVEFEVFGNGGTSWLAAGSSSSAAPTMSANGAAPNINVVLAPKGAGVTQSTGPVQLPAYTVAKLPICGASIVNSTSRCDGSERYSCLSINADWRREPSRACLLRIQRHHLCLGGALMIDDAGLGAEVR